MSGKKLSRGVSGGGTCSTPSLKKRSQAIVNRGQSEIYSRQQSCSSTSEKSGCQIVDPGQWLLWCEENNVIGSSNKIPLEHHEVECFKRFFNTMKYSHDDVGIHPHTLADSLLQVEVFPTFNEALQFAQKLREETCTLVTLSDIINTTQCRSNYKRNKIRSYIKLISAAEVLKSCSEKDTLTSTITNGTIDDTKNASSGQVANDIPPSADEIVTKSQSTSESLQISPTSVCHSSHFSEKHSVCTPTVIAVTVDSVIDNNEQCAEALDSSKDQQQQQQQLQARADTPSRNFINDTLETGRNAIVQLVSNATEMLGSISIFDKSPSPPSNGPLALAPRHPHTTYRRQDSGENTRGFAALKKYFSRSQSRSPAPSSCESYKSVSIVSEATNNANEISMTADNESKPPHRSPSTSPKSSGPKLKIRPVLKKLDSGEARIRPTVKFKRAAMKIYVANQLIHTFTARDCRVAAGFEDSKDDAVTAQRLKEVAAMGNAAGLQPSEIFSIDPSLLP